MNQTIERTEQQREVFGELTQRWNRLAGFTPSTGLINPQGMPISQRQQVEPGWTEGQNPVSRQSYNRLQKNHKKTVHKLKRVSSALDYLMSYMVQNNIPMPNIPRV